MSQLHNPPRWLETDELPPELRRDLSAYASDAPNVERRMRMLENLEQQLGLAEVAAVELGSTAVQPALGGATGAGVGAVAGTLVKLKLVLGLLTTAGVVLGVWSLWSSSLSAPARSAALVHGDAPPSSATFRAVQPQVTRWAVAEVEPTRAESSAVEPGAVVDQTADGEAALAPVPVARRERKGRPAVQPLLNVEASSPEVLLPDELPAAGASAPLSELTLLARARRSLLSAPERSLALAEQHAQAFPAGTLCEEREVLAIESLLKLGRIEHAKQRALAFERSFPSSAHRAHLARLIARPAH